MIPFSRQFAGDVKRRELTRGVQQGSVAKGGKDVMLVRLTCNQARRLQPLADKGFMEVVRKM
jgi:hypothetical protein